MPYTENHLLLRWGGPAWSSQEIWSNQLRLRQIGGDSPEALLANAQGLVAEIAPIVLAWFDRPTSFVSGGCRLGFVALNPISATTKKYLFPNQPVEYVFDPTEASPMSAGIPQAAYAVTLRSSLFNRGPAARGRFYVPMAQQTETTPTATGVLPAATATNMAQSAGTFLSALANLAPPNELDPVVPWLYGDGASGPEDSPILDCYVGNVIDTQRRRRNQIAETYYPGGYDPVA